MTKEEIKEAIASTIVENGQKGITATALANLLNEIVDAAGSGGGGGNAGEGASNVLYLDVAGLDGPNEHNAQIFKTLSDGCANGVYYQVCSVTSIEGFSSGLASPGYLGMEGLGIMIPFVLYQDPSPIWTVLVLLEDGSLINESQEIE
jgi:hypothetical protein